MAKKLTLQNKEAERSIFKHLWELNHQLEPDSIPSVLFIFESIILGSQKHCFVLLSFSIHICRKLNHPNLYCSCGKDTYTNMKNSILLFLRNSCKVCRLTNWQVISNHLMPLYFSFLVCKIKKIPNHSWFWGLHEMQHENTLYKFWGIIQIFYTHTIMRLLLVDMIESISQVFFKYSYRNILHLFQWTIITEKCILEVFFSWVWLWSSWEY